MHMKLRMKRELNFDGYYPEAGKSNLSNSSGLYFVYRGVRNENNTCTLKEILYIGQAEDICGRVNETRDDYKDWCSHLRKGEILYYSYCKVPIGELDEVEAACIFHIQPPCNTDCKQSYNHIPVRIISSGETALFEADFSVG